MSAVKEKAKIPGPVRSSPSLIDWVPGERYRVMTAVEVWEGEFVAAEASHLVFKKSTGLKENAMMHETSHVVPTVRKLPEQWMVARAAIQDAHLWEP